MNDSTPAPAPLALKWHRVKRGMYTADAPHGYEYTILRNDVDGGWDIMGGSLMTYKGFRNNLPTLVEAKHYALQYANDDQRDHAYQVRQTQAREQARMTELAKAGDVPAQRIVGMTPDSISADAVASAEDDDASGFEYRDDCEACVYDKQDHRMHADAERTGSMMDEWHAQDGDTYPAPVPASQHVALVRPMPGTLPRRRATAGWATARPAFSSQAGLASFRVGIAL